MIAWAHGTTGVVPGCGPSQLDKPFANLPAMDALLAHGWVLIASDYAGQGSVAPNPYLIGAGEAHSVLDAVRAAEKVLPEQVNAPTVVWGHSQGGHAALWTGALARTYAPDVNIVGVATLAPATDLRSLLDAARHTMIGRIMSAFLLKAYGDQYEASGFDSYTSGWRKILARDMANRCLAGFRTLYSVGESALVGDSLFSSSPLQGQLSRHLEDNSPQNLDTAPLLLLQGEQDDIVLPPIQRKFVRRQCAAGHIIELHWFHDDDHLSIVSAKSEAPKFLIQWTAERLAAHPWLEQCAETGP
jgi:alpha-beta hydrolase superfamily lysophospholipase